MKDDNEYKTFHLKDIKGEQLEEVGKYIAGFLGSILGYYLGKKVFTKIMGESIEIEELKDRLLEGKEVVENDDTIREELEDHYENDTLETIEELEELTGVKLFDNNSEEE